ncbi:MAG: replication-relaxation family protein [Candidatus Omnitrophota bacterium]
MKKGRLTKEEQLRRFRLLLRFIFTFRYATRPQLDTFAKLIIGLKYPQWLVEYSIKQGLISEYKEPEFRSKIYHLTRKGKKLIKNEEPQISYYHFEKRHAGMNTFGHHNLLVESFFLLQKRLEIKEWICEWVLRINKHKRDKIPDGLLILSNGTNLALEVETSYKTREAWRTVVTLYCYEIVKASRYDAILVVAQEALNYKSIKSKLYSIDPEFCARHFILTEVNMLQQGLCFYQQEVRSIAKALNSLNSKRAEHEQRF